MTSRSTSAHESFPSLSGGIGTESFGLRQFESSLDRLLVNRQSQERPEADSHAVTYSSRFQFFNSKRTSTINEPTVNDIATREDSLVKAWRTVSEIDALLGSDFRPSMPTCDEDRPSVDDSYVKRLNTELEAALNVSLTFKERLRETLRTASARRIAVTTAGHPPPGVGVTVAAAAAPGPAPGGNRGSDSGSAAAAPASGSGGGAGPPSGVGALGAAGGAAGPGAAAVGMPTAVAGALSAVVSGVATLSAVQVTAVSGAAEPALLAPSRGFFLPPSRHGDSSGVSTPVSQHPFSQQHHHYSHSHSHPHIHSPLVSPRLAGTSGLGAALSATSVGGVQAGIPPAAAQSTSTAAAAGGAGSLAPAPLSAGEAAASSAVAALTAALAGTGLGSSPSSTASAAAGGGGALGATMGASGTGPGTGTSSSLAATPRGVSPRNSGHGGPAHAFGLSLQSAAPGGLAAPGPAPISPRSAPSVPNATTAGGGGSVAAAAAGPSLSSGPHGSHPAASTATAPIVTAVATIAAGSVAAPPQPRRRLSGIRIAVGSALDHGVWDSDGGWRPSEYQHEVYIPPYLQKISPDDLVKVRELGRGCFGSVWLARWRGVEVALKELLNQQGAVDGPPNEVFYEAERLASLRHPCVIAFYGIVAAPGSYATVVEYLRMGSLKSGLTRLRKQGADISKRLRVAIALQAARGMEYLHGQYVVHFDLKCDNLLCDLRDPARPVVKIGDLGLSKKKKESFVSGNMRGTLPWMAPELFPGVREKQRQEAAAANGTANGNGTAAAAGAAAGSTAAPGGSEVVLDDRVNEKVDVFSFGVVLWEIWQLGEQPYNNMSLADIFAGVMTGSLRPAVPPDCDPDWAALMQACWHASPRARPSFSEIADALDRLLERMTMQEATATGAAAGGSPMVGSPAVNAGMGQGSRRY